MATTALSPLLVIGATARSAGEIITQGLAQGRRVTGFARDPRKSGVTHPNFIPATGDVYDVNSLGAAMTGSEVIISLIGLKYDPKKESGFVDVYSVGGSMILSAMRRKGNRRIITMTSGGTEQIPPEKPTNNDVSDNFVWRERNVYQDMQRWEKILAVSGFDYVVMRPRRLAEGPKRNNLKFTIHKNHTAFDERTGGPQSTVTYADVAAFALSLAEGNTYLGTAVGIYSDLFLGNEAFKPN